MSKEQNKNRLWVLSHIKELYESLESDRIEYSLKEAFSLESVPVARVQDWALEVLNSANDKEIQTRTKIHESLNKAIMSTQGELDELTKMRYRNLIHDERFLNEKTKLEAKLVELCKKLRGTEERADKWLELTEKTFNFATYARIAFMKGNDQKKKEILLTLGQNRILKNQKLNVEAYNWFVPIGNDAPELTEEYERVRTDKKPVG